MLLIFSKVFIGKELYICFFWLEKEGINLKRKH